MYLSFAITSSTIFTSFVCTDDVLSELAYLPKSLLRKPLSPIEAQQLRISKIRKLEAQYLVDNTFWNDKAKQILTESKGIDAKKITQFIGSMCDDSSARFPSDEVKCSSAFDPTALKNCIFDFDVAEVWRLCMQYKDLINVTNDNLIIKQYNDIKFLISEKLISGTIASLSEIAEISINDEQFNLLSMLVDVCCTFQGSKSNCERGFSLMNNIEVKSRNRGWNIFPLVLDGGNLIISSRVTWNNSCLHL